MTTEHKARAREAKQRAKYSRVDDLQPGLGRYSYWVKWVMFGPTWTCGTGGTR